MQKVKASNEKKDIKKCITKSKCKVISKNIKKKFTKGKRTQLLKKKEYKEKKWKDREVVQGNHFSHIDVNFEGNMIS